MYVCAINVAICATMSLLAFCRHLKLYLHIDVVKVVFHLYLHADVAIYVHFGCPAK